MADTYTTNYNLVKIETGTTGWSDKANGNMDTIDTQMKTIQDAVGAGSPYIDVRDFGTFGNGLQDDTAAIQAAIDACAIGGCVFIPTGVFLHTGITINKSMSFIGVNNTSSVLYSITNGPSITVTTSAGDIYYLAIANLRIENNAGTYTDSIGIKFTGANAINWSCIDSVHSRGHYTGFLNEITKENYGHNKIFNFKTDNYGANNTYYGIRYTGGHTVGEIISGCHLAVAGYGWHMVDYASGTVGIGDIIFTGNYVSNGINSIYLEGNVSKYRANFRVVGNNLMDCSSNAIFLKAVTGSTFIGNTISTVTPSQEPVSQDGNCEANVVDSYSGGMYFGTGSKFGGGTNPTSYTPLTTLWVVGSASFGQPVVGSISGNEIIIGCVSKASSPSGNSNSLLFLSADSSNRLEGGIELITSGTASNRRLNINCLEQGVANRPVSVANLGGGALLGEASLATNATSGFPYIPSCAGIPTGTPTVYTGMVPVVYDSTNNKFYVYNGAWKSVTLA